MGIWEESVIFLPIIFRSGSDLLIIA